MANAPRELDYHTPQDRVDDSRRLTMTETMLVIVMGLLIGAGAGLLGLMLIMLE